MQPDIIAFVRKVRELAQGEQWNRHEVDMLEEIEEILGYDVSEEQKHLEMKRVEKILRVHQSQSGPENTELAEYKEKERFLRNVQRQLSGCGSRCESVLERQIAAMEPEFEILKDELQEACNAGVNKRMMKNSQNFRTLILSKVKNFNSRLRAAAAPFSQELIGEYDRCFESVKGQVINTPLEAFHMTEKEWYEKGGHNLDLLHSRLQTEAASVCLEETAFEGFAMQCGAGLEKIWKKTGTVYPAFVFDSLGFVSDKIYCGYLCDSKGGNSGKISEYAFGTDGSERRSYTGEDSWSDPDSFSAASG